MNDIEQREALYAEGWALGLRSVDLTKWISERWEPAAAVAEPGEPPEKPKAAKKTTKKKAKKKSE